MTTENIQIRVLGPVSIVVAGRAVPLGYAKQRCVLALLALEAGTVVSPERIIERVWGAQAPESARGVLYGHVARLRRAFHDSHNGHGRGILQRRSGGYSLDVTPDVVDLYQFRLLAGRAREAGDDASRVALWREALGLWHGPALSCVDGAWVSAMRVSLEQERLSTRLSMCDARVRLGLDDIVLPELAELAADHPMHEGVAARLMLALYRTGHPASALEYFNRLRHRLAEQLGADPGPELAELQLRMLRREVPTKTVAMSA